MAKSKGRKSSSKTASRTGGRGRFSALASSFLFGRPLDEPSAARVRELGAIVQIGFAIWLLISMATYYTPFDDVNAAGSNYGGTLGFYLADWAFRFFGVAGYLLAVLGLGWGAVILSRRTIELPFLRLFGAACFVLSMAFLLDLSFGPPIEGRQAEGSLEFLSNDLPYGPGGWLAYNLSETLHQRLGGPGLWVILLTMASVSFMLATEMAFYPSLVAFGEWLEERRERWGEDSLPALAGWSRRLLAGLWDFIRGADLEEAAVATTAGRSTSTRTTRKKGAGKKKAPAATPELEFEDEEEYEEEPEEELSEDEEWVYEEDELDDDEEEAPEDEDEDEWEYEEEESIDEEWEYEEEPEEELELVPAPKQKRGKKGDKKNKKKPVQATKTAIAGPKHEKPTPPPGPWTLPPLDLLEPAGAEGSLDRDFLESCARSLENALKSFRVAAEVVGAQVGPAVTLFELTVAEGTRMNKVTALSQEIAATLKARSVRIIAPIPGKSTVGIEVPNEHRRTVRISELVTQKAYDPKYMALPLFLGMDAEGNSIVEDLARMPHLLIAGQTGSGKSVCINTILASFLMTRSPHDVRLILVDPKMVELQMFSAVPHLELPVVTDMKQATAVLLWAVEKMEGRYELFKDVGVKNIKGYNQLGEEKLRERLGENFMEERTPRHVPYIVVIIDEMADLMLISKKEAEQAITRLAQKSRAVGIHVIVATQRPSTDVITGVLKGNLPSRIAFQVASKIDSRVILDSMGAEKLLGQGDMLYTPPQSSQIRRVQGALVEDHELQGLVDFVCKESVQTFNQELIQSASGSAPSGNPVQQAIETDELFDQAVRVILKTKRGSASLLQRALGIGYTRASRLIDLMTEAGIVGEHKGSKARELMMSLEDYDEMMETAVESEG